MAPFDGENREHIMYVHTMTEIEKLLHEFNIHCPNPAGTPGDEECSVGLATWSHARRMQFLAYLELKMKVESLIEQIGEGIQKEEKRINLARAIHKELEVIKNIWSMSRDARTEVIDSSSSEDGEVESELAFGSITDEETELVPN
ncbi:hypothetical protein WDU94_009384 [Cyamophila willieti]